MRIVSRGVRTFAAALVGVGALASVGCGDVPNTAEELPSSARQDSDKPPGHPLFVDLSAPSVELTAPEPGSFLRGLTELTASASDDVGVARVDFYDGTSLIGSATQEPFTVTWDTTVVASTTHRLTAQAFDAAGNTGTSSEVSVLVDNVAPVIVSGAPRYNSQTLNFVRDVVRVGWLVTDQNLSGVALTEFLQEGVVLASQPGQGDVTYTFSWDTRGLANTAYNVSLRATDHLGNARTFTRGLVVDNDPPTVTLTAPADGAVVSGIVTLSANASDSQALLGLAFEVDGVFQTTISGAPPFVRTWDSTGKPGTHVIVAVVADRAGNGQRSAPVTVTVP
ncbi:Ig-like domain-containing protein [Myxococcus sp. K15C18031901]|uniref:Ig-like domain-containing protein n=1 Tax=Myxococcus dinghuensis TaxID=2906761 RepID=UPI0020A77129|nr:Ig-like domain-containing protein [Myxococcus dinghuensis]MCP3098701.1 Ig-like domain-containing protein [Myxococcus dinghuensis]